MNRKIVTGALTAFVLALASGAMAADPYPVKPIRVIVPVPPGGAMDITARLVAQKMSEKLGQPFIVENRPGGDTVLGTRLVRDAPADGYTILAQSNTFSAAAALKIDPGFDPVKDFTALGPMLRGPVVIEVGGEQPDRTIKDFAARAKTTSLSYASPGLGSSPHFAGAMMLNKLGLDVLHVPYKGASAAYPDVVGGRVQMMVDGYAGSAPYIKAGKMRALAVTSAARIAPLPDVPTLLEQGVDLKYEYWLGLLVRAGTPPDVVAKLSEALRYALSTKELDERFRGDGTDPTFMSPADFQDYVAKDVALAATLVKELKLPRE